MVRQVSLSSSEYPKGVNEFTKAGFTQIASHLVKPPRVKESPVQMECKVLNVIETGSLGGAANLIICEILLMHIDDSVLNAENKIDPNKIDLVARMGGDLYCRASGNALFEVSKPLSTPGIGIDCLPESIRNSKILTGNNLGQLGNIQILPGDESVLEFSRKDFMKEIKSKFGYDKNTLRDKLHELAKSLLEKNHTEEAILVLMCSL